MNNNIQQENVDDITNILLHDLKNMVIHLQNIQRKTESLEERINIIYLENLKFKGLLEDIVDAEMTRIKIPHRCPLCNGSTVDKEGVLCNPCDGRGIVWGTL